MKQLLFLVETTKVDCDIVYATPSYSYESIFKEDDHEDMITTCREKAK